MSAISAKALNSTLGTENFKGFDELLLEPKGLRPSDNILFLLSPTKTYTLSSDSPRKLLASLTPKISGGVKILLSDGDSGTVQSYRLQIYKNNRLDEEITQIKANKNEIYYKMNSGETYEFYLYTDGSTVAFVKCAAICADTVNLPAIF